ncbi:MAG: PTS sugar transporter subunit IIA [Spirochaetales bacterium]|nr:PTS sugar transporter subunit IIA [Spirochaetales bacterium]
MLSIYSLVSPKCIYINPDVKSKEELLHMMVNGISSELGIADSELLYDAVMKREKMSVTSLGFGCAVPHALTAAVEKTSICAAVIKKGIDYTAPDEQPVSIVLMMIGPESGARIHLKLLSRIARFLHNEDFRNQLKQTETSDDFLRIIKNEEEKCL